MQHYPTWRYHADGRAVVVNTPAEEAALGDDWADSPAVVGAPRHPPLFGPPMPTGTPDPPQAPTGHLGDGEFSPRGEMPDDTLVSHEDTDAPAKRGRPRKITE